MSDPDLVRLSLVDWGVVDSLQSKPSRQAFDQSINQFKAITQDTINVAFKLWEYKQYPMLKAIEHLSTSLNHLMDQSAARRHRRKEHQHQSISQSNQAINQPLFDQLSPVQSHQLVEYEDEFDHYQQPHSNAQSVHHSVNDQLINQPVRHQLTSESINQHNQSNNNAHYKQPSRAIANKSPDAIKHQPINHQPISHQSINHHQPTQHQSISHQSTTHNSLHHQSADHQATNHQSASHQLANHQSNNHQSTDSSDHTHQHQHHVTVGSINQPNDQSVNRSNNQSINTQSMNEPSTRQRFKPSSHQTASQYSQSVQQFNDHPVNQSVNPLSDARPTHSSHVDSHSSKIMVRNQLSVNPAQPPTQPSFISPSSTPSSHSFTAVRRGSTSTPASQGRHIRQDQSIHQSLGHNQFKHNPNERIPE